MTEADFSTQPIVNTITTPKPRTAGRSPRAIAVFLVVALVTLAADLGLKYVAFSTSAIAGAPSYLDPERPTQPQIPHHQPVEVVPHVLSLRLTTNTGAVFGIAKGARWIFIIVSIIAVGAILRIFWRSAANAWPLHVSLALILAGAIGNLYDRLVYSAVRDMLWLFPSTRLWPWIFNLADAALVVGVIVVLIILALHERRERAAQSDPN